jgi:hypothetical protein
MAAVAVRLRNEANTTTSNSLTGAFDVSFQVVRNDVGSGSFKLKQDDAAVSSVTKGSVVQFLLAGTARHACRVVDVNPTLVDSSDEDVEAIEFKCRGLLVDLEESVVQPSSVQCDLVPSLDERIFNAYSGEYEPDGSWESAKELAVQGLASTFYTGLPGGFTDYSAYWVSPQSGTTSNADSGGWIARGSVLVSAGTKYLEWAADNGATLYVNGKEVQSGDDFRKKQEYEFETTGGYLTLAWRVINAADDGPPGGNPTALVASLRSGNSEGTVIWNSTDAMDVLPIGDPVPKMPVGEVFRKCREGNDLLSLWTFSGTDTADTGTNTYDEIESISFRFYEDSLLDVLRQLTETWIDFEVSATGKQLDPYVKGQLGSASSLTLCTGYSTAGIATPSTVNIVDLNWDTSRAKCDAIAARWAEGWITRGSGDRWGTVRIEQVTSLTDAQTIADAFLDLYGAELRTAGFTYLPLDESTDLPFAAFGVHDTLAVPGPLSHNSTSTQQVFAVTITGGEEGDTAYADTGGRIVVEVGDPAESRLQWLERAVRRGVSPSLGGRLASANSKAPTAVVSLGRKSTPLAGGPSRVVASAPNAVQGESVTFPSPFVAKIIALRLIGEGSGGSSTVTVTHGSTTTTLTGSGEGLLDYEQLASTTWTMSTSITVELTTVNHTHLHLYADVAEVA